MSNPTTKFEEMDDMLGEVYEYAENCWRADEEGWFYPDGDGDDSGAEGH